jgi:hypothetical protein
MFFVGSVIDGIVFCSKKPNSKETAVIKPVSPETQKNEYRKVKIKISKAYHYKSTKGVESDHEMDKEALTDAAVPEVTTLTPRIITPPSTVIVIDSPPPEVPNNKPYYEPEVKSQNVISRYTPPSSSILENILLRNRIDTNNNDNNQRQPNATPPPSSPTEMAYSYKKSHRYGTVPCSPDSSSNVQVQNMLPPSPAMIKNHPPSPVQPATIYVPHNSENYSNHIQPANYYNIYPSPNGIVHSTITSAPHQHLLAPDHDELQQQPPPQRLQLDDPRVAHHQLEPDPPLAHAPSAVANERARLPLLAESGWIVQRQPGEPQFDPIPRLPQPALPPEEERRQDALRVQRLLQDFRPAVQFEGALEDAQRRAAFQVQRLHQELHPAGALAEAPLGAHGREAARVRHLQEEILLHVQPEDASQAAQRTETVCLRFLSGQVHAVRPSEAAQEAAHERTAVYLSRVRQELYQRVGVEDALEDHELQAQQYRRRTERGGVTQRVLRLRRL